MRTITIWAETRDEMVMVEKKKINNNRLLWKIKVYLKFSFRVNSISHVIHGFIHKTVNESRVGTTHVTGKQGMCAIEACHPVPACFTETSSESSFFLLESISMLYFISFVQGNEKNHPINTQSNF